MLMETSDLLFFSGLDGFKKNIILIIMIIKHQAPVINIYTLTFMPRTIKCSVS